MPETFDSETGEIGDLPAVRSQSALIVPLASVACNEVWAALSVAQGEFETPKRTKEASIEGMTKAGGKYSYKYKYAPLEEIDRVTRGPLAKNGLMCQQYLVSRGGQWMLRTVIGHSSGQWIAGDYPIFVSKEGAQGFASGTTYARRYGKSLVLGLAPEDDDDAQIADSGPAHGAPQDAAAPSRPQSAAPPAGLDGTNRVNAEIAFRRIKAAIAAATSLDQLNGTGTTALGNHDAMKLILEVSPRSHQKLLDEDAAKRLSLAVPEPNGRMPEEEEYVR